VYNATWFVVHCCQNAYDGPHGQLRLFLFTVILNYPPHKLIRLFISRVAFDHTIIHVNKIFIEPYSVTKKNYHFNI